MTLEDGKAGGEEREVNRAESAEDMTKDVEGLDGVADTGGNVDGLLADDLEEMERERDAGEEPLEEEEEDAESYGEEDTEEEEGKREETEQDEPEKFVVDGKEYTAGDIKELEAGALRQSDYTKKTTEAKAIRNEAEEMKAQFQSLIDEATGRNNFMAEQREFDRADSAETAGDEELMSPTEKRLTERHKSLAREIGEMKRQRLTEREGNLKKTLYSTASNFQQEHELTDEQMADVVGRINDVEGVVNTRSLNWALDSMVDTESIKEDAVNEYLKRKEEDKKETEVVTPPSGNDVAPKKVDVTKLSEAELEKAMLGELS